ncbi:ATP-dependent Lon protease pim1 [Lunasporangiospora selenospora]|uniref:ATP-dependent Lon protease pim1 n=1 Tax=Lunasporangiospora selenospora TaxID=979761 RepID=A0A9P6FPI7_9FUNG|nr:ATP-dependent Lon protease pim1 [Lunasporangiospora selenospora]
MASSSAPDMRRRRHRNVIVIPMDIYRKCTESSSSESSSTPAHWQSSRSHSRSRGRKHVADKSMPSSRKGKGKRHGNSAAPYPVETPRIRLTLRYSQQPIRLEVKVASLQHLQQSHHHHHHHHHHQQRKGGINVQSPVYHQSSHGGAAPQSSISDRKGLAKVVHSPPYSGVYTPSTVGPQAKSRPCSQDLMTPTIIPSSESNGRMQTPFCQVPSTSETLWADLALEPTTTSMRSTLEQEATAALKRKQSEACIVDSDARTPIYHHELQEQKQPETKRLKIRLNMRALHQTKVVSEPTQMAPPNPDQEVIVISDDEDDDRVRTGKDNCTGPGDSPFPVRRAVSAGYTSPKTAIGSDPVTPDSPTEPQDDQAYHLSPHHQRIVNTIFPEHERHYKETLEQAFATCEKLREDYIVDRFLGSGISGFVISAKRVSDGKEVAIKVIPYVNDQTENKVRRELDILVSIKSHENILDFVEYFTSSASPSTTSPPATDIYYIVTEMGGWSLFDFIEMHKPDASGSTKTSNSPVIARPTSRSGFESNIDEGTVRSIFMQLSLGLHSLHSQNVVHGDIKDENALISVDPLTNTYRAKLCDFGHSKYLKPDQSPTFTFYGTTILAPPEMDSNIATRHQAKAEANANCGSQGARTSNSAENRHATKKSAAKTQELKRFMGYEADVWAMGLMLYTLVHGDLPAELGLAGKESLTHRETSLLKAYERRRQQVKNIPFTTLQKSIGGDLKDLLKRMLAVRPEQRITMAEVLSHPWMARE